MTDAATLIRDHIAALPESDRVPWHDGGKHGIIEYTGPDAYVTVFTYLGAYVNAPHRALVALLASPDVAQALADLLDAIRAVKAAMDDVEPTAASAAARARNVGAGMVEVMRKADALEQTLTRGRQP